MEEENKYHFAREIIFNLRACKAITDKVYLHWIDKLIEDEKQAKNNKVLDLVMRCSMCDSDNLEDCGGGEYSCVDCGKIW
jgi:hypothetical protein